MPKKKIAEVNDPTDSRKAEQTKAARLARLAEACSALDPEEEPALAEKDLSGSLAGLERTAKVPRRPIWKRTSGRSSRCSSRLAFQSWSPMS